LIMYVLLSSWLSEELELPRICIPFTPPSPEYMSVEEIAKRAPNLSYHVYLADPKSTREIDANVRQDNFIIREVHLRDH
jgi:hypothetical protein